MFTFSMSRAAGDPRLLYAGAEGYGMTPEHWELIGKELVWTSRCRSNTWCGSETYCEVTSVRASRPNNLLRP